MTKINFAPKSNLGKWSIGLIVMMPVLFYIAISFVGYCGSIPAGETILYDIIARPQIALPMLAGFISGIAAFFAGIIGIIRKKDRSILVFLSTAMGFLVLLWCLTQFIFSY